MTNSKVFAEEKNEKSNFKILVAIGVFIAITILAIVVIVAVTVTQTKQCRNQPEMSMEGTEEASGLPSNSAPATTTPRVTPTEDIVKSTECDRPCSTGDVKTCLFDWDVTYYYSMSERRGKPCGDCPANQSHCFQEGCIALNGIRRPVLTVNRQIPGPKIIACEGDTIRVKVANNLEDKGGLSIHWHGIHNIRTPFMDGVAMVTQCPIVYGTSFTYVFNASPAGTHFWHSHIGTQRGDGLAGALIIRKANDPLSDIYDTDDSEHILIVQDWITVLQIQVYVSLIYNFAPHQPDFLLINGQGKGPVEISNTTYYTPREVIHVTQGQRHRIRIIGNVITACPLEVSVDSHTLVVISMDGSPIKPVTVDKLVLYAGERYDVVLHANQNISNYLLRVEGVESNSGSCKNLVEFAIIRYNGSNITEPETSENSSSNTAAVVLHPSSLHGYKNGLTFASIKSVEAIEPYSEPTTYYISLGFANLDTDELPTFTLRSDLPQINHISFYPPPAPILTQSDEIDEALFCDIRDVYNWTQQCSKELCRCIQTITAELNETIDLFYYHGSHHAAGAVCHPMHLHGHYFRVVGIGNLSTTSRKEIERLDNEGYFPRNLENSTVKDTVCVNHGSYLIVRFVASNPGWWLLHCHQQYHTVVGMALVVHVGTDEDIKPLIPQTFPRCGSWNEY